MGEVVIGECARTDRQLHLQLQTLAPAPCLGQGLADEPDVKVEAHIGDVPPLAQGTQQVAGLADLQVLEGDVPCEPRSCCWAMVASRSKAVSVNGFSILGNLVALAGPSTRPRAD
jgi:hypothetical protein